MESHSKVGEQTRG